MALPSASTRDHTDGLRRSSRANTPDIGVTAPDPAEVNSPGPAVHAGGEPPAVRRKLSTSSGSSVSSCLYFPGPVFCKTYTIFAIFDPLGSMAVVAKLLRNKASWRVFYANSSKLRKRIRKAVPMCNVEAFPSRFFKRS